MKKPRDKSAIAFVIASILVTFALGMASAHYDWFPHRVVRSAVAAAHDLRSHWGSYSNREPTRWLAPARGLPAGVSRWDKAASVPGYTFISTFIRDDISLLLLAPDGTVFHRWPIRYLDLFSAPEIEQMGLRPFGNWDVGVMGATLLADGAAIFTINNGGLVKLDRCGKVVWKRAYRTHHSVVAGRDGTLWVPSIMRIHEAGEAVDLGTLQAPLVEDSILHLDAEGNVISEVSLPRTMIDSGLNALLLANGNTLSTNLTDDYTHLNKVVPLSDEYAPAFPMFAAGDLLLSLRHLNLVMVVDPANWRVKWHQTGPWLRQHDAKFTQDGRISVFDNRADNRGGAVYGGSRITATDPATHLTTDVYVGTQEDPFYTDLEGEHVYLPNGNLLISEAMAGRIFEVERGGRIVWQYVNSYDAERVVAETHAYARVDRSFVDSVDWSCAR